jgi:DNA-binding MarR family transcriptional regulator
MNTDPLFLQLHTVAEHLRIILDEALLACGLTMAQWTALRAGHEAPGASGADLARACRVSAQTMHTTITGLERMGLVVRQPHAVHGRVVQIYLSNAGERRLAEGHVIVAGTEERVLAGLSEEERALLHGLLARVAGGLAGARRG